MAPPTYQEYALDQFINIESVPGLTVFGDGVHDDTANTNAILSKFAGCKLAFFPHGTYIVTNTIFVPTGFHIVGEVWSAISAVGGNFFNSSKPVPMVKVGKSSDVASVQPPARLEYGLGKIQSIGRM